MIEPMRGAAIDALAWLGSYRRQLRPPPRSPEAENTKPKAHLHAYVALAVTTLCLDTVSAQQMPTDIELKAAYCLAVTKKQVAGMEQAKVNDPVVQKLLSVALKDGKDRLRRLERYLTPRMQTLEPLSVLPAMNHGEEDYSNYNEQMNKTAPACIIDCQLLNSTGAERSKAMQCLNRCVERNELIARVNSCSKLTWLPL